MSAHNERITITTSKEFAEELRRLVPRKQRSLFIESAAAEKLRALRQKKALGAAAGAWKDLDHPDIVNAGVDGWLREIRGSWPKRG
jgi:hypothetical protein